MSVISGTGRSGRTQISRLLLVQSATALFLSACAQVYVSPDVATELSGVQVTSGSIALDTSGVVLRGDVGILPQNANLIAYHRFSNGDQLLGFDVSVSLPGGLHVQPGDLVRYDGSSFMLFFDAAANGVPAGARVDAAAVDAAGNLLISFDITVQVGSVTVEDEDLVRFDGAAFSAGFDASAAGVSKDLDLDAAHIPAPDILRVSFDGSSHVGGVDFADEDVLQYDVVSASWSLYYRGSSAHASWGPADLDAFSE